MIVDLALAFIGGLILGATAVYAWARSALQKERRRAELLRTTMTNRGEMLDIARYVDSAPPSSVEDYHRLRIILVRSSEFWVKAHVNRVLLRFEIDRANQTGVAINPLSTDDDRDRGHAFVRHMEGIDNPVLVAAAKTLQARIARLAHT